MKRRNSGPSGGAAPRARSSGPTWFLVAAILVLGAAIVVRFGGGNDARAQGNPGERPPAAKSVDLEEQARRGREVYRRLACWQCHSQLWVDDPDPKVRFGPTARHDPNGKNPSNPVRFSSRRAGPDLSRGRLRPREWQLAHLYDPRAVTPGSQMPAHRDLFLDPPNAARVKKAIERYDSTDGSWRQDGVVTRAEYDARPSTDGRAASDYAALLRQLDAPTLTFGGKGLGDRVLSVADAAPRPGDDAQALLVYLDQVGKAGPARRADPAPLPDLEPLRPQRPGEVRAALARGASLYVRHCAGCHGDTGNGNGPAAAFFGATPPRNFLHGAYRFRSTKISLAPTIEDLARSIRRGVGPAMPAWPHLSARQLVDLALYLQSLHPAFLGHELFVDEVPAGGGDPVLRAAFLRWTEDELESELADAEGQPDGASFPNGRVQKRGVRWLWIRNGAEREIRDKMKVDAGEGRQLVFRVGEPRFTWMAGSEPRKGIVPLGDPPFPYTAASAKIGEQVYKEFGCFTCHGPGGRGDGQAALVGRGHLGQLSLPADYTRGAVGLKGGADARSIVRTFVAGLAGSAMPVFARNFQGARAAPPVEAPWRLAHFVMRQAGIPYEE